MPSTPIRIFLAGQSGAPERWFVVYTNPLCEKRVSKALRRRQVTHYLPRARRWKRQSRRAKHQNEPKRQMTSPLLTRYVFVAMPSDALHFGRISDLDGVHGILSDSDGPIEVKSTTVLDIAKREADGEFDDTIPKEVQTKNGVETVPVPRWVDVGVPVVVTKGPYSGFPGRIEEIVSSDIVKVGVSIFGRSAPVNLEIDHLQVA